MSGRLKSDNAIIRYVERGARNLPVDPLTLDEKNMLIEKCWEKCRNAYRSRISSSGLLADYDEIEDLVGEAYLLMNNILDKFDKSRCGEIHPDTDIPGRKSPKTLMFYFKNYFYGRVNFTACEAREFKKSRGNGPRGVVEEVSYDEEFNQKDFSLNRASSCEFSASEVIIQKLKNKDPNLKNYINDKAIQGLTEAELEQKWEGSYTKLKSEFNKFKAEMRKSYGRACAIELGKLPCVNEEDKTKILNGKKLQFV